MVVRLSILRLVVEAKEKFQLKEMDAAYEAWCGIYKIIDEIEKESSSEMAFNELNATMRMFTNDEVYGITDYGREKEYKKQGLI